MKTRFSARPIPDNYQAPPLGILFQFVDGSVANFFQPDPKIAERIWSRIHVAHLFTRPRIVIADDYSKSVFVCSQINRIDFIFEGSDFSQIPDDHAEVVELSELVNLSNLLGYTVYPGVPEIPSDVWMAVSSDLAPAPNGRKSAYKP